MCNKPLYRLVLSGAVIDNLPPYLYKRVKKDGIIMSKVEYETLINVYGISQHCFQTIPCGVCMGCKVDYMNTWTARAMCEASLYKENYFVTLTYNDDNLPLTPLIHPLTGEIKFVSNLVKEDYTAFFKRLRRRLEYMGFDSPRFLACGEYGDNTRRAHFHFLGFNLHIPDLTYYYSRTRGGKIHYDFRPDSTQYFLSNLIAEAWGKGFILITPLTLENCAYVCSYVNKQLSPKTIQLAQGSADILDKFNRQFDNDVLTQKNAVELGLCRSPFLHMSRNKGIGNGFFDGDKISYYYTYEKLPNINGKKLPKQSIRYFDNIIKNSDVHFILDALKAKRRKKMLDTPALQWSDFGQRERDIREESLLIKQSKKKPRDL